MLNFINKLYKLYCFLYRQPQPNVLNETHMMQQIQQLSQTIQKNEELNRQKILQQQQAEFDQQIGHVCFCEINPHAFPNAVGK